MLQVKILFLRLTIAHARLSTYSKSSTVATNRKSENPLLILKKRPKLQIEKNKTEKEKTFNT